MALQRLVTASTCAQGVGPLQKKWTNALTYGSNALIVANVSSQTAANRFVLQLVMQAEHDTHEALDDEAATL